MRRQRTFILSYNHVLLELLFWKKNGTNEVNVINGLPRPVQMLEFLFWQNGRKDSIEAVWKPGRAYYSPAAQVIGHLQKPGQRYSSKLSYHLAAIFTCDQIEGSHADASPEARS